MKRNIFCLFFLVSLFASCSQQGKNRFQIGVSQCSMDSWREMANEEFRREASFYNDLDLEIRSVADQSEDQIRDVEYFIKKGVDLLVISPNESTALTPVVEKAYLQGIPVILYDRKIDSEAYTAYVGADNRQVGRSMGDYLQNLFPGREVCNIVLVRGTVGSTADQERYEGLMDSIQKAVQAGNIRILASCNGGFSRDNAKKAMQAVLDSIGVETPLHAVLAFNDRMAEGVHEALDASSYPSPYPAVIGVDALPKEGVEDVIKGVLTASFMYPTGGDVVIDVARKILYRSSFDRQNILNTAPVDINNARVLSLQTDEILSRQAKIDELNQRVDAIDIQSRNQRRTILFLFAILGLVILLGGLLLVLNHMRHKLNRKLQEQNRQIQVQVEELQTLSRQLEEATQAKLVFFTNISHEFKTPLSLIIGPVQELLNSGRLDPEVRETLELVHRNSSRLYSLINEILEFRSIENGKIAIENSDVDLVAFMSEINALFQDIVRRRQVSFQFETDGKDCLCSLDKNKFEKIYFNLLSNAFKHVHVGGVVRAELRRSVEDGISKVRFSVFNSDSFIPEDQRADIFQRFYKLDTGSDSTGIGLALSASLTEAMGGTISVESSRYEGTRFTVEIPVLSAGSGEAVESVAPRLSSVELEERSAETDLQPVVESMEAGDKARVLVIEDNADMRKYIRSILREDYQVLLAEDGRTGLKMAGQFVPDIILCDIMMPEMSGYEVCKELKGNLKTAHIPVVFLTALNQDEQREKGYSVGADSYLEKPFHAGVLKARISQILERERQMRHSLGADWLLDQNSRTADAGSSALLAHIKQYVEDHLTEEISIDAMLTSFGMSKSAFYRKIKAITDYSTVDLVNMVRLHHALNLILHGGRNISQAAFESGFNSVSYFSRIFTKFYHESPRNWLNSRLGKS